MDPADSTPPTPHEMNIYNAFALGMRVAEELSGNLQPHSTANNPKFYDTMKGIAEGDISSEPSPAEMRALYPAHAADAEAAMAESRNVLRITAQTVLRVLDWARSP